MQAWKDVAINVIRQTYVVAFREGSQALHSANLKIIAALQSESIKLPKDILIYQRILGACQTERASTGRTFSNTDEPE